MQKRKDGRKLVAFIVILLFFGVACSPSINAIEDKKKNIQLTEGNTLYVGGNGRYNYTKIQYAIDNASAGDTVFVYDDSSPYYENIVVDKSIYLIGEDKNTTIIDGTRKRSVVDIVVGKVHINNFSIRNSSHYSDWAGIYIDSDNNNISCCNIYSNYNGIDLEYKSIENIFHNCKIFSNKNIGIKTSHSRKNRLKNCIISNNRIGLDLALAKKWNITNNEFINNGIVFSGYIFTNEPELRLKPYNHLIENNTVNGKPLMYFYNQSNVCLDGITVGQIIIANCSNVEIKNLVMSDTDIPIYNVLGKNIKIQNCDLFSNNGHGIVFRYGKNIRITDCHIYKNKGTGLVFESSSNCSVYDCCIESNRDYGIVIYFIDTIYFPLKEYLIVNCEINKNNKSGIWIGYRSETVKITNCFIKENKGHGIHLIETGGVGFPIYQGRVTISYCTIDSNKNKGINIIDSSQIYIFYNNFINHTEHVFFEDYFYVLFLGKKRFFRNYWDDWNSIGRYRIRGELFFTVLDGDYYVDNKLCNWRFFDWFPALKPHNINGGDL